MIKPNKTAAITKDALETVALEEMSIRSQKAFFAVLAYIYWGTPTTGDFLSFSVELVNQDVVVPIEYIANTLGYAMNKRITTEIRKIYRVTEAEAFGDGKEVTRPDEVIFKLTGFSKNKENAIFHILRPEAVLRVAYSGRGFWAFSTEDISTYTSKYTMRILYLLLAYAQGKNRKSGNRKSPFVFTINTYFLKQWLGMDVLDYCSINKKKLKEIFADRVIDEDSCADEFPECYADCIYQRNWNKWTRAEKDDELELDIDYLVRAFGFKNREEMQSAYNEIVTFERVQFEEILQKALSEINNAGHMFIIHKYKNKTKYDGQVRVEEQYFCVLRKKNHYVKGYRIQFSIGYDSVLRK